MMGIAAIIKAFAQFAWPIALVVVGIIFKADLKALLSSLGNRQWSLKVPGGFEAIVATSEQQQGKNPAEEKVALLIESLAPSQRPAVNIIETRIRNDLESVETSKRDSVLLRALAQSRLEAGHEFTYNRIFGSQIAVLKRLNEAGRATIEDAQQFFELYAKQYPEVYNNYGFRGWLGFLSSNALVSQQDNIFQITEFGRDFWTYLTEKRLAENKSF